MAAKDSTPAPLTRYTGAIELNVSGTQELWTVHEWSCRLAEELPALDPKEAHDQVLGPGAASKAGLIYRAIKDQYGMERFPRFGWDGMATGA